MGRQPGQELSGPDSFAGGCSVPARLLTAKLGFFILLCRFEIKGWTTIFDEFWPIPASFFFAEAQGNIEALGQLLNRSQDVTARSSALVAAGSHCHARAMELLKDHGATVDGKPKCEDSVLLRVVEQHAMNTQVCQQPAKSVTGVAQNYTALWDVLSILQQMDPASAQNCRGLFPF